jgi:hypothetical protein
MQDMNKRDIEPDFPVINEGRYLWDMALTTGLSVQGMSGPEVMPWSELAAIGQVYSLDQDEIEILRKISAAFLRGFNSGNDPLALSPMEMIND